MRVLLAFVAICLFTAPTFAGPGDLRTGMFHGKFCNQFVTFEVKKRLKGKRVFRGKLLIHDTAQYDDLLIEQYRDKSLKIVRVMTGKDTGKRIWAYTYPPAFMKRNAIRLARFDSTPGKNSGCPYGKAFLSMPY